MALVAGGPHGDSCITNGFHRCRVGRTKAWIAAPPGSAEQGYGTVVTLSGRKGKSASVYGQPGGTSGNVIGSTPAGSAYLSPWTVTVSGTTWYAINYNHRQEWVPASEVTSTGTT